MPEIEEVMRGSFRVMIKLGMLDPPEMVPFSKIKDGPAPWTRDENKAARAPGYPGGDCAPEKPKRPSACWISPKLKSIAVVGQRSNDVAWGLGQWRVPL